MIINQRTDIKWGEVGGTFMYGSKVTYHEDKALAEEALRECIEEGLYPEKLYN